jgi:putative FmdB family regulatory protein
VPLYDFRCRTCGHEFEALVRGNDGTECPACHGSDVERLLSAFVASTDEARQKSAKASRERQIRGRRDQLIADAEYRKQHEH